MTKKHREEGQCPYCGSKETEVLENELDTDLLDGELINKREWLCNKCHKTFTEFFKLVYQYCVDEDGNGIK